MPSTGRLDQGNYYYINDAFPTTVSLADCARRADSTDSAPRTAPITAARSAACRTTTRAASLSGRAGGPIVRGRTRGRRGGAVSARPPSATRRPGHASWPVAAAAGTLCHALRSRPTGVNSSSSNSNNGSPPPQQARPRRASRRPPLAAPGKIVIWGRHRGISGRRSQFDVLIDRDQGAARRLCSYCPDMAVHLLPENIADTLCNLLTGNRIQMELVSREPRGAVRSDVSDWRPAAIAARR